MEQNLDLRKLETTSRRFSLINTPEAEAVDKINDSLLWGAMNFCRENGFQWMDVPTLTKITGACENVDTLYKLEHGDAEAYLAQTGQLYLEAKIPLHEKVWTIIDSSRNEPDADTRHLNQFKLFEIEHHGDLNKLLRNLEKLTKAMMKEVLIKNHQTLKQLGRVEEIETWVEQPFSRMSYTECIKMLKGTQHQVEWGEDLKSEEEEYLVEKTGNKPLFITHFPKAIKFFNMRENDDNSEVVNSTDLIMPYSGESAGAAERENDYTKLKDRLTESPMFKILSARGKTLKDFEDYLEMVKTNSTLHSGCGIGLNRITQSVLGSRDIRVSCSYPIQRGVLY